MKLNKTYYIITIGCQMNKSDSERIAGYLESFGYALAKDEKKAGVVVLTTCGVRQSAEDRIYGLVNQIKKNNPKTKLVLTGCLSGRSDVQKRLKDKVDVWLNISDLSTLADRLAIKTEKTSLSSYFNIKPKCDSKYSIFIPIGNGCNNFCAYCVVPYARGREVYRPAEEILAEAKEAVKNGYKEIILIAQNVNSYRAKYPTTKSQYPNKSQVQNSKQLNFANLLRLINNIPGNFWIRFATSHPKDMSDDLIKTIASCEKVCEHIHLPAQAGDDKILSAMNRKYTIQQYKNLIEKIRKDVDNVSMSTDIIVGFPGETKKQFNNTVKLFKQVKFDLAYIARYSPRPGTAAEKLKDDVPLEEKKRRELELNNLLRKTALENNKKYIGQEVEILVSGKNKAGFWHGYTRTNKHARFKSDNKTLLGKFVMIQITSVKDFGLEGQALEK